jgi:hypothetical protein
MPFQLISLIPKLLHFGQHSLEVFDLLA